jgi:hypothetical protein
MEVKHVVGDADGVLDAVNVLGTRLLGGAIQKGRHILDKEVGRGEGVRVTGQGPVDEVGDGERRRQRVDLGGNRQHNDAGAAIGQREVVVRTNEAGNVCIGPPIEDGRVLAADVAVVRNVPEADEVALVEYDGRCVVPEGLRQCC